MHFRGEVHNPGMLDFNATICAYIHVNESID
jgi:hypothetical protein